MSVGGRSGKGREDYEPLDSESMEPQGDKVKEDVEYSFPEEHKEPFRGLNFLGRLTKEFEYLGHRIVIKTLTTDEILAVSQVIKNYEGTLGQARAYATAIVAACTVSIDNQGMVTPIGEDSTPYSMIWQRFNYAKSRWYPSTIDAIHEKYLVLENQVDEIIEAMGKASG